MKSLALLVLVSVILQPLSGFADDSDDTLKFYLSKSDVAIPSWGERGAFCLYPL